MTGSALLIERHTGEPRSPRLIGATTLGPSPNPRPTAPSAERADREDANGHRAEAAIRPERFARLVTLASILIEAGRAGRLLTSATSVPR